MDEGSKPQRKADPFKIVPVTPHGPPMTWDQLKDLRWGPGRTDPTPGIDRFPPARDRPATDCHLD